MRLKITAILSFCTALAFGQQQTQIDSVLTFKDAVRVALQNNATLITQRNNLLQTKVNKTYRLAQLGPQASITASLYQSNGNRFIQQEAKVVNATVNGLQAQLSVNQPIFNGLNILSTARQASSQLDAQLEQVNRSAQDVINTVSTQFLQVLLDQELLKIAHENLVLQQKQFELIKEQVAVGSRSPVDEYNQQAQVSTAEVRVVQAELTLTNDKVLLFQSLMVDPTIKTRIEEPLWDVNAIALDNLNLDQLLEAANQHRSDLKSARDLERASKFGVHASKGNYFPSLYAFYNNGSAYNQVKGADKSDPSYRNFHDQFVTDNRSNSFGLSLNIPIFTGFQNRYFYIQSKVTYENNKLLTKSREITVKSDVLRAYENFESVKKGYSASLTGLEASKMALDLEQERYNLGITSFVDFATANRTYVQAQTDMAQAKYRFLFQKILLDYAVGTLKVDDIPQ
ncbi:TolC family protein [Chryseosolibacter indicus]|uniref:TolC family protein n=1 Tax=Chryseosolibacter indicus TaxID=2782351 RepID=A0ABS5VME0_9BACT|nr:TolC family protein [Chryseosolibacter indicus]MBT1702281.1 TolC family protein [Chryseosolibacter indicus]